MDYTLDENFVRSLDQVWAEIGLSEKQRLENLASLQQKLARFYFDSLQQASQARDELKEEARLIEAQIKQLQDIMGLEAEAVTVEKSLLESKPILKSCLTSLQQLRDNRLTQLRELSFAAHSLSQTLEISLPDEFQDVGSLDLTEARVESFQDKIQELKSEKAQRTLQIQQIVKEISELITALGAEIDDPATSASVFSLNCLSSGSQGYSTQIIEKLNEKKRGLLEQKEHRIQELSRHKDKINLLWNWLNFTEEQRAPFSKRLLQGGFTKALLEECTKEIEYLELIKKQTVQTLITDRRSKISELWESLHYDEATKQTFPEYSAVEVDEALLEAHDIYVKKLEVQFQQSKLLIRMISRRELLLKQQSELDAKIQDPNRLLGAGRSSVALLSEDASRTAIKKELPKLERNLEDELKQWVVEHDGLPFLFNGIDYLQSIYDIKLEEEVKQRNKEQARRGLVTPSRDSHLHTTPAKSLSQAKTTPYKAPNPAPMKAKTPKPKTTGTSKPALRPINNSETAPSGPKKPAQPGASTRAPARTTH